MPRTSRALLLVQSILVALGALASVTTMADMFPGPAFPTFVVLVGAGQAALAFYAYGAGSMSRALLVTQTVMAGALFVASSAQSLADALGSPRWLALVVIVVNVAQAGVNYYVKYAAAMPGDPLPVSELPPPVKRLVQRDALPANVTRAA